MKLGYKLRHGACRYGSETYEYKLWKNIKTRCLNPNTPYWKHYGGRGITICQRWLGPHGFERFLTDLSEKVGPRPSSKHQLDRKDNNKGYSPNNVRWSTREEQVRNKRNNRFLTVDGITKCLADWAILKGISEDTISNRLSRGWTVKRAVCEPASVGLVSSDSFKKGRSKLSKPFAFGGLSLTFREWGRKLGVSKGAIRQRIIRAGSPYGKSKG